MGLKVKLLPSLFRVPSCTQQPKTSSFRLTTSMKDDIFKTINSVYFDQESEVVETPESWFTHSSEASRLSASDEYDEPSMSIFGDTHLEAIVRGAQQSSSSSNRLLFDPTAQEDSPRLLGPTAHQSSPRVIRGSDVRSLTTCCDNNNSTKNNKYKTGSDKRNFTYYNNNSNTKNSPKIGLDVRSHTHCNDNSNKKNINKSAPFKESVAMSVESDDPYEDFKRSMEEMVESLKVRDDWEELEELLGWYLKVNGRKHHGYIISAFIDLLVGIVDNNNNNNNNNSSSSCDDQSSTSDDNVGYISEIVRCSTSFCSATSSLTISSCGSNSD